MHKTKLTYLNNRRTQVKQVPVMICCTHITEFIVFHVWVVANVKLWNIMFGSCRWRCGSLKVRRGILWVRCRSLPYSAVLIIPVTLITEFVVFHVWVVANVKRWKYRLMFGSCRWRCGSLKVRRGILLVRYGYGSLRVGYGSSKAIMGSQLPPTPTEFNPWSRRKVWPEDGGIGECPAGWWWAGCRRGADVEHLVERSRRRRSHCRMRWAARVTRVRTVPSEREWNDCGRRAENVDDRDAQMTPGPGNRSHAGDKNAVAKKRLTEEL